MSTLNEIRNMRRIVQDAARRKQESDRMNAGSHIRDSIKSAYGRKKVLDRKTCSRAMSGILSWNAICLLLLLSVNLFLAFRLFHSMAYPGFERSHLYARNEDFKKAEKFVNRFLGGNFSDIDYFKPEKSKALWKSAPAQLAGYEGIPAARVEISDRDDEMITYRATCIRGKEAAIIYLTPAESGFHVSGIEIDREYAMNNPEARQEQ